MNWTIYRGEFEPVTKINKAEITIHPNHIEVVSDYQFVVHTGGEDRIKSASIWSKTNLSIVEIGELQHPDDESREIIPTVFLKSGNYEERIKCATQKEAESIYLKIPKAYIATP